MSRTEIESALSRIADGLYAGGTLVRAGLLRPERPDRSLRALRALRRWGPTLAAAYTNAAARHPHEIAVVDELGEQSFQEIDRRTNALARALAQRGIRPRQRVAIMCRNHRGFVEISVACSKLGADVLYLNTAFARPQIEEVVEREAPVALVYDEEFAQLVAGAGSERRQFLAFADGPPDDARPSLEQLIASADTAALRPPTEPGRVVILTSGTTGAPKGANRASPSSLLPAAGLLSKIPLRSQQVTMIAAPLFHSWGLAHFVMAGALSSKIVLRRRFDPEQTLAAVAEERASALIVVPVMLQRMLELDQRVRAGYDTSSLRVIASSGSALPGPLAQRVMDAFGETLYNLYGSTEVAWATIATPADLRAAPGTAGRPPRGTVVRILGPDHRELPQGENGRIFVGNEFLFEGYTGGTDKERYRGLMATGDVGHFDPAGRLFVDGRDDDMIVSGGENVFPAEVEHLLAGVDGVREVAVIGVADDEFGQRLRAYVVLGVGVGVGVSVSEDELKQHVKSNLAAFKVPREIVFLDELPRNATGKVLKRELAPAEEASGRR